MNRLFRIAQSAMAMDDATWKRHANPWSVYSRMTVLPLLALAIWGRVWLGWWALGPVALCLGWIWLNPRLFPAPDHTENWASEGTFGERLYMEDEAAAMPHKRAVTLLTAVNALGFSILLWGLIVLDPWITLWGLTATMGAKLWTFDRMVWLWREVRRAKADRAR